MPSPPHGGTVTSTQLALAIVGSIIASSLITIIVHLIFLRHKKLARLARSNALGKGADSIEDLKFPSSGQARTTIEASQSAYKPERQEKSSNPRVTFSLFPMPSPLNSPVEKQPALSTNAHGAADAQKSPSLRSWLRYQNNISPFGPIQFPTDQGSDGPLGGQLKSPLQGPPPSRFNMDVVSDKPAARLASRVNPPSRPLVSPKTVDGIFKPSSVDPSYRESKASQWTDAITDDGTTMPPPSPNMPTRGESMQIPTPNKPIRNTAEWLMDRANFRADSPGLNSRSSKLSIDGRSFSRPSITGGLPNNPRKGIAARMKLRPSVESDREQSSNGLLDPKGKGKARENRNETNLHTPGVGKAM